MALPPPKSFPRVPLIWLGLLAAVSAWICYALARSWPYSGQPHQMLLLLTLPGAVFCIFLAAWHARTGRPLQGWRRWVARLGALAAGFMLAGTAWDSMDKLSMQRFEHHMAPLIGQMQAQARDPCPPNARYEFDEAFHHYLNTSNPVRAALRIHHDGRQFVVVASGRSSDIDGSSIYYDSQRHRWTKFHNDQRKPAEGLAARVSGLIECKLALPDTSS